MLEDNDTSEGNQPPTDSLSFIYEIDLRRLDELKGTMERELAGHPDRDWVRQQSIWFEDIKSRIAERIGILRASTEISGLPEPRPKTCNLPPETWRRQRTFDFPLEDDCDRIEEIIREEIHYVHGRAEPIVVTTEVRRVRRFIDTDEIVRPWSCVGCRNYHGAIYSGNQLICGMHPYGWGSDDCPDFEKTDNDL